MARQRQGTGRWDFTSSRKDGASPIGYCAGYREFTGKDTFLHESQREIENERMRLVKDNYHTDGHATEEEAQECYKKYILDNKLRLNPEPNNPQQMLRCQICKEFTAGYASVGMTGIYYLCKEHCNREGVEKLYEAPSQIWES